MTPFDLAVFAAKLLFGTLAFLLIGWIGNSGDKRVAGAMLTFPVLNGIGLVTSTDKEPFALTAAMMPMIVLNGCLCFGFILAFDWAKRIRGADERAAAYAIAIAAAAIWSFAAAWIAPRLDPHLPSPGWIAAIYIAATVFASVALWSCAAQRQTTRPAANQTAFLAFWCARRGRVALFALSLFALLLAAHAWDAAWVGRLSALPIVPLFVLAGLAADNGDSLPAVRDTILLGPGLAMIFVPALTLFLSALDPNGGAAYWLPAMIALGIGWAACFLMICYGMPRVAAALDGLHGR